MNKKRIRSEEEEKAKKYLEEIYSSKNTIYILDYTASLKGRQRCQMRGQMKLGYPRFFDVTFDGINMNVTTFAKDLALYLRQCTKGISVAYCLFTDIISNTKNIYYGAFMFKWETKEAAIFSSFTDDQRLFGFGNHILQQAGLSFSLTVFKQTEIVERLTDALNFIDGGYGRLNLSSWAKLFEMFNRNRNAFVSFWPDVKKFSQVDLDAIGRRPNGHDTSRLPIFAEIIALKYNNSSVCARFAGVTRSPNAKTLQISVEPNGVLKVDQIGDEPDDISTIVKRCHTGMTMFGVHILLNDIHNNSHTNVLIVDGFRKEIELFEPNGFSENTFAIDETVGEYLKFILPDFNFIKPMQYCPAYGLQNAGIASGSPTELCVSYAFLYCASRIVNPSMPRQTVVEMLMNDVTTKDRFIERFILFMKDIRLEYKIPA